MTKSHSFLWLGLIAILLVSCESLAIGEREGGMLTSVEQPEGKGDFIKQFVSLLNPSHPGNRIGYRFFEHKPLAHGSVPEAAGRETAKAEALEKQYADRSGVFVRTIDVKSEGWVPQRWEFYIVPLFDGFDLLWVVTTKAAGLNEYYVAQQCFRMSGETNKAWRRKIAETPAFSEYDLWAAQERRGEPKTSLSYVRRSNYWEAIPPTEDHVVCRTPLGLAMDTARSGGDLGKITGLEPYGPSSFEPDVDCGLVTRTNAEGSWICALHWERTTHVTDHHPADCLHSFVNLGPLPPQGKRAIRGRIYWMKASKNELFALWADEFSR